MRKATGKVIRTGWQMAMQGPGRSRMVMAPRIPAPKMRMNSVVMPLVIPSATARPNCWWIPRI